MQQLQLAVYLLNLQWSKKAEMKRSRYFGIVAIIYVTSAVFLASCMKGHNNNIVKTTADTCTNVYLAKENDSVLVCLPTAFTPNGDGKNDVYAPIGIYLDSFRSFQMSVYASDTLVYQSTCIDSGWNGTDLNKKKCTGYKYDVRVNVKYPSGKTYSNCTYVFLIPANPINGCIQAFSNDTLLYKFADQFNDTTGQVVYPTSELFCP